MNHLYALIANFLAFACAAMLVWWAAKRLTGQADAIAERTGLGQAVVGFLLLGAATSLPEVAVSVSATLHGTPELTVNDVLGSAAINVLLLALADIAVRRHALTALQDSPKVGVMGVLGMMMMAVVAAQALSGDVLLLGLGAWSWALLAIYVSAVWILGHSHAAEAWRARAHYGRLRAAPGGGAEDTRPLSRLIAGAALSAALILVAGYILTRSGESIARQTGLGTNFFGVVFMAVATSMAEISTVIAAVRLRRYEMAVADIFGTNLFNASVVIVLTDALHGGGPVLADVGPFASLAALLALLMTAVFVIGILERRDRTVFGVGIDSLAVILMYGVGLTVLYAMR